MNFLAWLTCLGLIVLLALEAVNFSRASICRQKAWLKSTELITRTLLYNSPSAALFFDPVCKIHISRKNKEVSWRRLPLLKKHSFALKLYGKL